MHQLYLKKKKNLTREKEELHAMHPAVQKHVMMMLFSEWHLEERWGNGTTQEAVCNLFKIYYPFQNAFK